MRAAAVLALLVLAGCVTSPSTPSGSSAHGSASAWSIDCALGNESRLVNATWTQDCAARASHTKGPKEETWAAINPKDPRNVVIGAKDLNPDSSKGCVWNGVFVTHDAGKTWKDVVIGGKYADRKPGDPFFGYACNTDPMFQFTKDGALHYGVEEYNFGGQNAYGPLPDNPLNPVLASNSVIAGWKILLATSKDGGDTWPDIVTYQQDEGVVTDYSRMTVNPTTQSILEMIGAEAGGCHVLASRDGGKTADPAPGVPASPNGIPCGTITASPKGTVVLLGADSSGAAAAFDAAKPGVVTIGAARSTDDGKTFTDDTFAFQFTPIPQFKESQYRVGSGIEATYDLTNGSRAGTLYAVYAGATSSDEADVFLRSSTDDGKTWTTPVRVNDDNTTTHQWMPNVAVAGDGSVHVFFMDKRYDPAHKLIDITHAVSTDGGVTWANERVTSTSFDGDLGRHQEGFPFIGDYLGVACGPSDCWVGFPDASDGQTTVISAAHVARVS